jgi:DNA-binding MarR family transcriptional regulator
MATNKHEHKTAIFEDGTHAVLRFDPADPRRMELVAIFYEAAHAEDYVRLHAPAKEHQQRKQRVVKHAAASVLKRSSAAKPAPASKAKSKPLPTVTPRPASEAKPKRVAQAQPKPAKQAKAAEATSGITDRQTAVLKALRSRMDKKHHVETKATELAKASSVPLGSLHSILASLEKKHMIRTERRGSPKFSAIYEVLETSRKPAGGLNGRPHGKAVQAQAAR